LVPVLFTFCIQDVLKFKKIIIPAKKVNLNGDVSNKSWNPLIVAVRPSDLPRLNSSLNMLQSTFNPPINGECWGHNRGAGIGSMFQCTSNHLNVLFILVTIPPVTIHKWNDAQVSRLEHQSRSLLNLPAGTAWIHISIHSAVIRGKIG